MRHRHTGRRDHARNGLAQPIIGNRLPPRRDPQTFSIEWPDGIRLATILAFQAAKKRTWRDAQHPRQLIEPAGADAVGTAFIFLKLLKRDADLTGNGSLTHTEQPAAQANFVPNMNIHRVRLTCTIIGISGLRIFSIFASHR